MERAQLQLTHVMLKAKAYGPSDETDKLIEDAKYECHLREAENCISIGITHMVWMSTCDDKCCELCKSMNGRIIDIRGNHPKLPPIHKGCRCTVVAHFDE